MNDVIESEQDGTYTEVEGLLDDAVALEQIAASLESVAYVSAAPATMALACSAVNAIRADVSLESIDSFASPAIALESVKDTLKTIFKKIREMLAALKARIVSNIRRSIDGQKTAEFKARLEKSEAALKKEYANFKPAQVNYSEKSVFATMGSNVDLGAAAKAIAVVAHNVDALAQEIRHGLPQWMANVDAWAKEAINKVKDDESLVKWANETIAFGYRESRLMSTVIDPKAVSVKSGRDLEPGEKYLGTPEMIGGIQFVLNRRELKPANDTAEAKELLSKVRHNHLMSVVSHGFDGAGSVLHIKSARDIEEFRVAVDKLCSARELFQEVIQEMAKRYEAERPFAKVADEHFAKLSEEDKVKHGSAMQNAYTLLADPAICYLDHASKVSDYVNYLCGSLTAYAMRFVSAATGQAVGVD